MGPVTMNNEFDLLSPKDLLLQITRSLASVPDAVEIQESESSFTNESGESVKRVVYRIVCDKTDASFIVGDNGGNPLERNGAVLRGIRAIFRNIGKYDDTSFDIDMADSVKAFRKRVNTAVPRNYRGLSER